VIVLDVTAVLMKATPSRTTDREHPQSNSLIEFYVSIKNLDLLQITKWCEVFEHFT